MKRLTFLFVLTVSFFTGLGFASAYTIDFEDLGTSDPFNSNVTDPDLYQGFSFYGASSYAKPSTDDNTYRWDGTNGSYSIAANTFGGITIKSATAFDLESFYVTNDATGYTIYYSGYNENGQEIYNGSIENANGYQQYFVDLASWGDIYEFRISTSSGGGNLAHVCLDDLTINPVPIPGAVWLLGSGLIGLVGIRRRFNKS